MSVPQSRLLLCLLTSSLLATTSLADTVVVNTTVDENNVDNQSCSLRESLHYLNAKNVKKATNDAEIAVISGTSTVLTNQLTNAQAELTLEREKTSPDLGKIATLETQIAQLKQIIDAGTSSLNRKLIETKESLATEKSKTTPNTALIANYEASIKQLETSIKAKEEEKTAKEKEMKDYRAKGLFGCVSSSEDNGDNITLKKICRLLT
ncbi:MAG: CSLREA domain-containing protein [Moraxellaceae bacterium]|nr:CSLREA domain-containing protein [Moraxellaceae bacterium]